MAKPLCYWIKERYNPQLGTYYILYGQLSFKKAKEYEKSIYGSNVMHKYATKDEYNQAITLLEDQGARIHRRP
jgi:hypothetical protein